MSTEDEFSKWLRRKEKTFEENLKFAIKSWQSVEFTLNSKYEIILRWVSEQKSLQDEQIIEDDFKELLKLRTQPGLIVLDVKEQFVEWCLHMAANDGNKSTRKWCELLALLVVFEPLQDMFRMNYKLLTKVYGCIFTSYETYIQNFVTHDNQFLNTHESEFFASILSNIKDTIKRCGHVKSFESAFTSHCVNDLVNVLLVLRGFNVDFFEELLEIERLLCVYLTEGSLMVRIMAMPLHVRLLVLECAIVNRKGTDNFLELLLRHIFASTFRKNLKVSLSITVAAYTLEMLCRHDVNLSFQIKDQTALQFLGKQIYKAAEKWRNCNLKELLMLLCAALRLNPLILEENVFNITVWMMLSKKSGDIEEKQLFEEYLILLMDMFRRLSRAEKFVANLLKTLNENANEYFPVLGKKRKLKHNLDDDPAEKRGVTLLETAENETVSPKYVNILFKDYFKPNLSQKKSSEFSSLSASTSFPNLHNFWPSNPVGVGFSKIITGLVSKPSLVIWKTLLFSLKDLIGSFADTTKLCEKSLFLLDFHVALLTQYLTGCKLAEQSEKFVDEIKTQRQFTLEVLQLFGKFLLGREHDPRTMTAFLEVSYYATCFELMLIYYRPDGCDHESLKPSYMLSNIHGFLSEEEWTLIQQRILNFGKSSCKYLLQRLQIQKSQSSLLLLGSTGDKLQLDTCFASGDNETMNSLLIEPSVKGLISRLSIHEKSAIAGHLVQNANLLPLTLDDLELLEFVSLAVYENICSALSSKHSLLKSLSCDFEKIRHCVETSACETLIKQLIETINSRSENEYKVKKLDSKELQICLDLLSQLPMGYLRRQRKTIVFALHLSLYRDLKSAQEDELAVQALEIMKDLLHFGQQVLIFKYFPTSCLIKLLPPETCWELYEFLFSTIKYEEKGTEQFLQGLATILQDSVSLDVMNDGQRKLLLIAIDTLSSLSGACAKRMRKHLEIFLKIFSEFLSSHFKESNEGNFKKDKKFVQKTLAGFAPYASMVLTKISKAKDCKDPEAETNDEAVLRQEVDEDFRRISKIYIGHSMDYRNAHAIRLMQVALNHRELLHLDQDEIELVLTNYWTQIKEDLKVQELQKQNNKTMESAIKMIISNKTNEDLLITLKSMATNIEPNIFSNVLRLLNLIAKCPFSTIKGAIFNEQYKQIIFNITLRLSRDEQQQFKDHELIINLLRCHQTILDNKVVPLSTDTIDNILSFLIDINIKKFPLRDTNLKLFSALFLTMTDVCSSLIKQRHLLLMDRVPQYMHVFKDLIQSVVLYKSDRQKDTALPSEELDTLSELAMKLESLMHLIAQHSVGFKRVAPFVLTFIINLMVSNKRPTTLYHKIKTHIENICYDLVGICDHRVGRFILRCSNEAGRQLYELLVKDYQKYHKFKGKV